MTWHICVANIVTTLSVIYMSARIMICLEAALARPAGIRGRLSRWCMNADTGKDAGSMHAPG